MLLLLLLLPLPPAEWSTAAFVALLSLGEAIWSPRWVRGPRQAGAADSCAFPGLRCLDRAVGGAAGGAVSDLQVLLSR